MRIFQWFDTREIDELAQAIAAELVKRVPPSALDSHTKKAADRLRNTHDAIFARASKFARTRPLNIYKRARLGNQFRWALKEAGYPSEFVESWTYELVTLITLNTRAGKGPGR
jgi:isocitrate dehydrogenase kinase/phosphatase